MKGKSHKRIVTNILKRVMSAMLVVVMLFMMAAVYIPAETFKAVNKANVTIHFKAESYLDQGMGISISRS